MVTATLPPQFAVVLLRRARIRKLSDNVQEYGLILDLHFGDRTSKAIDLLKKS